MMNLLSYSSIRGWQQFDSDWYWIWNWINSCGCRIIYCIYLYSEAK